MIQCFDVSVGGDELPGVAFPGIVPVLDGTSVPVRSLGPDLGEHTQEVLSGLLGLSDEQIASATRGRMQPV